MKRVETAIFGSIVQMLLYSPFALSAEAICNSGNTPNRECVPIFCGKTVLCEGGGGKCTILEGDYNFFIRGITISQHSHVYTLNKISVITYFRKGVTICNYSSDDGFDEIVQFNSIPTMQIVVLENSNPNSPDYGWIAEKVGNGFHYTCDATKFTCPMYY